MRSKNRGRRMVVFLHETGTFRSVNGIPACRGSGRRFALPDLAISVISGEFAQQRCPADVDYRSCSGGVDRGPRAPVGHFLTQPLGLRARMRCA